MTADANPATDKNIKLTLSGTLGSGKSTIGRLISRKLGVPYISTGELFREIGRINNLDALRANLAAEDNVSIDHMVDERIRELDRELDGFVLDSRMAWKFTRNSTRVYLSVMPRTAAERILGDQSRSSERYADVEEALESILERRASEVKRYKGLYDVEIEDRDNYDFFLITDGSSTADVADTIIALCRQTTRHPNWIPKCRLVPLVPITDAPNIKSSSEMDIEDGFALPLRVENNYGFYSGKAVAMVDALNYGNSLVPYVENRNGDNATPIDNLTEAAARRLTHSHLREWEAIASTKFDFHGELV